MTRYRIHLESRQLAPGTINGRLAAVRRLAYEAADSGLLSPDLAAGIRRVKGPKNLGIRIGNWLTADQARILLQVPDPDTLKGKRDRALLGVLLGCGLRRKEAAELDVAHLQRREDHWAIVDLVGKGRHIRTIPVPDWVKSVIDTWLASADVTDGRVFRCVCRAGKTWGGGVRERVVWHVVKDCAKRAAIDKLAPHDLRRTCARLCRNAGGELDQIQFLLGHVSVQTNRILAYSSDEVVIHLPTGTLEGKAAVRDNFVRRSSPGFLAMCIRFGIWLTRGMSSQPKGVSMPCTAVPLLGFQRQVNKFRSPAARFMNTI